MNGAPAHINTPLEPNSEIVIEPSTAGAAAVYTLGQLDEYNRVKLTFIVNGQQVECPKLAEVNGRLEPASYEVQEGDAIEMRDYYYVRQLVEYMDAQLDEERLILVNNKPADDDTLVYGNFSVDWTLRTDDEGEEPRTPLRTEEAAYEAVRAAEAKAAVDARLAEKVRAAEEARAAAEAKAAQEAAEAEAERQREREAQLRKCVVTVNGETIELTGKTSYIFVDIFERVTFDLTAGQGRAIATLVNGKDAEFSQELQDGDRIDLYWKER